MRLNRLDARARVFREGSSTVSRACSPLRALARGSVWVSIQVEAKRFVLTSALKAEILLPILEPSLFAP
jgi:hypothetical protein